MEKLAPLILLAAGGTGGHLFPAEALGVELMKRGYRVRLATDSRALRYSGLFSKDMIDVVPSETVRSRAPWSLAYAGMKLGEKWHTDPRFEQAFHRFHLVVELALVAGIVWFVWSHFNRFKKADSA